MVIRGRALPAALVLAAVVVGIAVILRAADLADGRFPFGGDWLPLLVAMAAVLAAGVLRRHAPAVAWPAAVAGAALGALEVVGAVRARQVISDPATWPYDAAVAEAAAVIATAIAAAYVLRFMGRSGLQVAIRVAVLAGLGLVVVTALTAVAGAANALPVSAGADAPLVDLLPLRTNGRLAAAFIALAMLGGMWADLAGPVRRARARGGGFMAFPRALADELLPTGPAMRRRGVEDERARLAAELHARVLPDLRRAAEAAEASGTPSDPLAIGLRHAVEDVEELMHGRQSVVLEEYGLVAALEWLAERTQQRRALEVDVELEGTAVDSPTAIPKPVARAAFRVTQLAVDNVIRHAGATRVVVRLTVDEAHLVLSIEDDGIGLESGTPGSGSGRASGRGIADMRAAAAEVGAALRIERRERGTLVQLSLDRASSGAPAARAAAAADAPSAPGVSPDAAPGR